MKLKKAMNVQRTQNGHFVDKRVPTSLLSMMQDYRQAQT